MKKQNYVWLLVWNAIILYILSLGIAYQYEKKSVVKELHESWGDYTFISPLLECNNDNEYFNPGSIKRKLNSYVTDTIKSKNISDISYYVRLLNNGSAFGYNENIKFIPASLVKLPLGISVMRQVPPDDIEKTITITNSPKDTWQWDFAVDNIKVWQSYSIYELLSEMLINSDNNAAIALLEYLNTEKTLQTYEKFGLGLVDFSTDNSLSMSVKSYASFFRVLYNSSYLTREWSETLLSLLSKSSFDLGIRWPIPKNVIVANKFWVRSLPEWEKHIHDCGIIYDLNDPYLLCVMTRGKNEEWQLQAIRDISKMVYEDIISK